MGKISESLGKQNLKQCVYRKIFLELDDEDATSINDAVSKGKSGYTIAMALQDGGYKIAPSTVALHIAGRCKCNGSN